MLRASFLRRLYLGYVALILLTITVTGVLVGSRIQESTLEEMQRSLKTAATVLREWTRPALASSAAGEAVDLQTIADRLRDLTAPNETRLTVMLADGRVVGDSHEDPTVMENHADRPEVLEARRHGVGQATRRSDTLDVEMMYVAVAVRDPERGDELVGFCRTALPLDTVDRRLATLRDSTVLSALAASLLALVLGWVLARRFTRPLREIISSIRAISRGELDRSIEVRSRDEFGTLARAFEAMRTRIREHNDTITADRNKILAILSAMTEGVIAVDRSEEVVHLNAAAGRMFGIDPPDAIGRHMTEVVQIPELQEAVRSTFEGVDGKQGEIHLQTGMSSVILELQSSGLRDRDGEIIGVVIVLHDVTEIRRLEEVRSDFVSNVSHELKTPLAAIKGLVESILEDEEMPEPIRRRFLGRVQRQADRLNSLVVDLLSLSRLERELDVRAEGTVELRRAVLDCVETQRPAAEQKGLHLHLDLVDEDVRIVADAESVRQIVDNLLSNAIRYTPADGHVTLRLGRDDDEARLEVEDTGVGIDPSHHERIFERFYRVDKARSRELGGTGLGLAIVKHVVRRLGGSIGLDSEVGRGSTFTIEVPLAKSGEGDPAPAERNGTRDEEPVESRGPGV